MDNGTHISYDSVSAQHMLHSCKNCQSSYDGAGNIVDYYSDTVFVSFMNGRPIYGYKRTERIMPPFGNHYTLRPPILSETVGFSFDRFWPDKRYGDFNEKVRIEDKYFDGQDSVLILEGHWVYGPAVNKKSYQKYLKRIGLTYEVIIDTIRQDTLFEKKLVYYLINH